MSDNVHKLPDPPKPPEWIVGPFEEYRVIIDGRMIPKLNAYRQSDGRVTLILDKRFIIDLPDEGTARMVAGFVANALAIGEGYPFLGAANKAQPFAPQAHALDSAP